MSPRDAPCNARDNLNGRRGDVGGVTGGGNGSDENVASHSRSHVGRSLDEKRRDAGGGLAPGLPVSGYLSGQLQPSSPPAAIGSPPVVSTAWAEWATFQARWRWAVWLISPDRAIQLRHPPPTPARLPGLCLCQRLPTQARALAAAAAARLRGIRHWRCRLAVRRRKAVHWCRRRRIRRPPTVCRADGRPSALHQPAACLPHCRRLCSGSAASTAHRRTLPSNDILSKPPHQRRLRLAGMACVHLRGTGMFHPRRRRT